MKYVFGFFLLLIGLGAYFGLTDGPGNGMGWACGFFALILGGVLLFNKTQRGGWLSDKAEGPGKGNLNSFAAPLLFLVSFDMNRWLLLGLLLAVVWTWALTRKREGGYIPDLGRTAALVAAVIFTVAALIGAAIFLGFWGFLAAFYAVSLVTITGCYLGAELDPESVC